MKISVINGPNMNLLGIREPEIYGKRTYNDLTDYIRTSSPSDEFDFFQSNHEGEIIDYIQGCFGRVDGIVLNAAAYTHTSLAIADAVRSVGIPCVEVHMSDVSAREEYRHFSYLSDAVIATVSGKGFDSYTEAVKILHK